MFPQYMDRTWLFVLFLKPFCSQTTILYEHCANNMQLKRSHVGVSDVKGISSAQVWPKGRTVQYLYVDLCNLSSNLLDQYHSVLIWEKIATDLPKLKLSHIVKRKLKDYTLADPTVDTPGPIDLLIEADLLHIPWSVVLAVSMITCHAIINTVFCYVVLGHHPIPNSNNQFAEILMSSFQS